MLRSLPSLTLVRLWAAVLLATIGLQALDAAPPSLERRSGSAFSASTQEVALYVQRGERVQRQAVAPQPIVPFSTPVAVTPARTAELAVLPAPRPDSTGPPAFEFRSWNAAPRAPPRA
ncbi:hypothetical protein WG901_15890 [Novosphingobium sp. PS1R-30]|uniref:Uncharacterized protein n=1 Tax=Novosphingobium anseongense TaxID=3133436 RepID=A0ABU8RYH1_9SPHN